MLIRGEIATIMRWLEALPADIVRSSPPLALAYAWGLVTTGQFDLRSPSDFLDHIARELGVERRKLLEAITADDVDPERRTWLNDLGLLEAFIGRDSENLELAANLFLAVGQFAPADDDFTRAIAAGGLGSIYIRQGAPQLAEQSFVVVAEAGRRAGSNYIYIFGITLQGRMLAWQGKLNQATNSFQQALNFLADQRGRPLPFSGQAAAGLADILREQNNLMPALNYANEGISLGEKVRDYDAILDGLTTKARTLFALGQREDAYKALDRLEWWGREIGYGGCLQDSLTWRARLNLAAGDVGPATRWAAGRGFQDSNLFQMKESKEEKSFLTYCRLLLAQGKAAEALHLLEWFLTNSEKDGRYQTVIETLVLNALSQQALGRRDEAIQALSRAMLLAESEGFVRTFIDEGPAVAALVRQAAVQGRSPEYAGRLLTAFGLEPASSAPREPLSLRELEVLALMADGLTNLQIAAELIIAVSTVKTHINRIYSKLDVQSRTQAVARGRALKLIS